MMVINLHRLPLVKKLQQLFNRLSSKQRQWLWFVALWLLGLGSILLLASFVRFLISFGSI